MRQDSAPGCLAASCSAVVLQPQGRTMPATIAVKGRPRSVRLAGRSWLSQLSADESPAQANTLRAGGASLDALAREDPGLLDGELGLGERTLFPQAVQPLELLDDPLGGAFAVLGARSRLVAAGGPRAGLVAGRHRLCLPGAPEDQQAAARGIAAPVGGQRDRGLVGGIVGNVDLVARARDAVERHEHLALVDELG